MRKSISGEFQIHEIDWEGVNAYIDGENLIGWLEDLLQERAVRKRHPRTAETETSFGRIRITVSMIEE